MVLLLFFFFAPSALPELHWCVSCRWPEVLVHIPNWIIWMGASPSSIQRLERVPGFLSAQSAQDVLCLFGWSRPPHSDGRGMLALYLRKQMNWQLGLHNNVCTVNLRWLLMRGALSASSTAVLTCRGCSPARGLAQSVPCAQGLVLLAGVTRHCRGAAGRAGKW